MVKSGINTHLYLNSKWQDHDCINMIETIFGDIKSLVSENQDTVH